LTELGFEETNVEQLVEGAWPQRAHAPATAHGAVAHQAAIARQRYYWHSTAIVSTETRPFDVVPQFLYRHGADVARNVDHVPLIRVMFDYILDYCWCDTFYTAM
jgi:hypothetical protein